MVAARRSNLVAVLALDERFEFIELARLNGERDDACVPCYPLPPSQK
ncbi:MAG TPA: hypothetical protein VFD32_20380 [Dehalococcoidia bacterium]|nr:hypothetical protein [Dehalococcoidia bacterium]